MRIWGQLLPGTAEPGIIRLLSRSSFLPLQQSSSGNDHLVSHKINLYSLMKLWDSAWYFKCLFSPFSRDLLLYSRSLFHLQLFLCSSACFLGKLAELGLVEQDCDFVRVQQRWGICGLVQFFSLLSRSFLILVGGTCPNFLDNNSQATCMEQL